MAIGISNQGNAADEQTNLSFEIVDADNSAEWTQLHGHSASRSEFTTSPQMVEVQGFRRADEVNDGMQIFAETGNITAGTVHVYRRVANEATGGSLDLSDLANIAQATLLGRAAAAGTGAVTALTAAQALDVLGFNDFEVGTFTPTFEFATPGTSSISYNNQDGWYIRINEWVIIIFRLNFDPTKGTASGNMFVKSLPFTVATDGPVMMGGGAVPLMNNNFTWPGSTTNVSFMPDATNNAIDPSRKRFGCGYVVFRRSLKSLPICPPCSTAAHAFIEWSRQWLSQKKRSSRTSH